MSIRAVGSLPFLACSLARGGALQCCTFHSRSAQRPIATIANLAHCHERAARSLVLYRAIAAGLRAITICTHVAAAGSAPPAESITENQQQQIDVFVSFLLEENEKYNLTGAQRSMCS